MPPAWSHELKWAYAASLLAHGAVLAWLPAPAVHTPATPPPLQVRLSAPAGRGEPATPAGTAAAPAPKAAPAGPSPRDSPELAEPAMASAIPALPAAQPVALRSRDIAAQPLDSRATAPLSASTPAPAFGETAASAAPPAVAPSRLRSAASAEAVALVPAANPPVAAASAVPEVALPVDAARPTGTPETLRVARAGVEQRPNDAPSPGLSTAVPAALGVGQSQAHARDKTPWAAAVPVAAVAQPQAMRAPSPAAAAEASAEPRAQAAADTPVPARLQALPVHSLSLVEAEGAPSTAIAHARLSEASRACYAPPPAHWNAQGRVVLRVQVDAGGRPVEVMLESGSGEPRLDRLAVEQTRDCARFDISDRQGRRRAAVVRLPVVYKFKD